MIFIYSIFSICMCQLFKWKKLSSDKKMSLIVISTMSHFWPPTLTSSWKFIFASLFSMVYTPHPPPPPPKIFFFIGGELISFLGEEARPFSSIKPSMTNHVNSNIVDCKIIYFLCVC